MNNPAFNKMLSARGWNTDDLADSILTGRSSVTMVLNGLRPGGPTWRKLKRVLSAEEYECAKTFADRRIAQLSGARKARAEDDPRKIKTRSVALF